MGYTGCYVLHVYCDFEGCDNWTDIGNQPQTAGEARNQVRELGWYIEINPPKYRKHKRKTNQGIGWALCPAHAKCSQCKRIIGLLPLCLQAEHQKNICSTTAAHRDST